MPTMTVQTLEFLADLNDGNVISFECIETRIHGSTGPMEIFLPDDGAR